LKDFRLAAALFFAGVALVYLAFSPFFASGMGYVAVEMATCRQIAARVAGGSPPPPIAWPHNGAAGLLFQCPFVALGDAFAARLPSAGEGTMSLQPLLATSLLVTVLFVWASRLAGSRAWGFAIALAAAFATLLWPYAYIGLETTQSLFLFLAGYVALDASSPQSGARPRSWPRVLCFAACAALAISAKSGGILLAPAVAYLAWCLFSGPSGAASRTKALATLLIVAAVFGANSWIRHAAWARLGGMVHFAGYWRVHDPITPLLQLVAFLASPNKGLFVFAPLTLVAALALPRAFAADRRVVVFALLTLFGFAGTLVFLEMWSDETWGPRYLHAAVAPLLLGLAASRRGRPLRLRTEAPLAAAVVLGLGVSFLGSAFYYGLLMQAANAATPLTLQSLQGDLTWNHIRFNALLLRTWAGTLRGATAPRPMPPPRIWKFDSSGPKYSWQAVDLRPLAIPQPLLLREVGRDARDRWVPPVLGAALIAGALCLAWVARATRSEEGSGRGRG
jgi:hypothetical protein